MVALLHGGELFAHARLRLALRLNQLLQLQQLIVIHGLHGSLVKRAIVLGVRIPLEGVEGVAQAKATVLGLVQQLLCLFRLQRERIRLGNAASDSSGSSVIINT